MVSQDWRQACPCFGLQKVVNGTGRQRGKGFVGGRKNGEGTVPFQGFNKACGLNGGNERAERACADSRVDNIGAFAGRDTTEATMPIARYLANFI